MPNNEKKQNKDAVRRLQTSLLLLMIALVSIVAATAAWFSISDNGRIRSMDMQITSGKSMRFDLDAHKTFEEYIRTLGFDQIAARMQKDLGFDMKAVPMKPTTTSDVKTFTLENGEVVSENEGLYLTFTLHFMAQKDMIVHLTSSSGEDQGGTVIASSNAALPQAMRISFEADGNTYVYDAGIGDTASTNGSIKTFGLPVESAMVYNENNAMFSLKENVDKPVLVHVWLEGTDEACTNDLKGADYAISLRFQGTDENNKPVDEEEKESVSSSGDNTAEYYTQREETADEQMEQEELTWWDKWVQFWDELLYK